MRFLAVLVFFALIVIMLQGQRVSYFTATHTMLLHLLLLIEIGLSLALANNRTALWQYIKNASTDDIFPIDCSNGSVNCTPLHVEALLQRWTLAEVNEHARTLSFHVGLSYTFTNPLLAWNEDDFGEISVVEVPFGSIWTPGFSVCESLELIHLQDSSSTHKVQSNGTVSTNVDYFIKSHCMMNFANMPFDVQRCFMCLYVGSYITDNVTLIVATDEEAYASGTSEWAFHGKFEPNNYSFERTGFSQANTLVWFRLKRNSTFFSWLIICPSMLIVAFTMIGQHFTDDQFILAGAGLGFLTFIVSILQSVLARQDVLSGLGRFVLAMMIILCVHTVLHKLLQRAQRSELRSEKRRRRSGVEANGERLRYFKMMHATLFTLAIMSIAVSYLVIFQ